MFFKEVIGQEEAKRKCLAEVREGRIAHAQLLYGTEGAGKLALAVAYARYICCTNRSEQDACGQCPSCIKFNRLAHPDLHFVYPVVKKKAGKDAVSDDYISEWRRLLSHTPYFGLGQWLNEIGAGNAQALIYAKESDEIARKLSLKSSEGGYKVMIIWLPEKMHPVCSNKLLKLLEEPPRQTVFLLVSETPEMILPTILSRTQRIHIPRLDDADIAEALQARYGIQQQDAGRIARLCEGNFVKAMETIHLDEDRQLFFDLFVSLMRLAYQRKLREMKQWSEQVAAMGRERQKSFLDYCQHMLRENFMFNFRQSALIHLTDEEAAFASRFAPFVNERNVMGIMHELSEAQQHVEQNVNPKMIFFDFSLKMIVLLKQ